MNLYEGINTLLGAIGEIPITDNTQAQNAEATSDVGIARDTVQRISKIMQEQGYWFNTEVAYPMVPNTDGYIPVGSNILSIYSSNLIVKDYKLYDTALRTFQFTKQQLVDVVFEMVFDDLPYVMANAIIAEATIEFYNNVLGDTQEIRILDATAQKARVALQKAQMKHVKPNLISGSRIISRTQNPIGLI